MAASFSAHRSFPLWAIAAAGLVVVAAIGREFFARRTKSETDAASVPASMTTMAPAVAVQTPLPSPGPAVSVPAALPEGLNGPQISNASHDELLALAKDMLARGRSLEDVIALLDYLAAGKPEFALDLARDIGRTDDERHVLLLAVLSDWAHADAAAALQWAFQKSGQYNVPGNTSLFYVVLEQVAVDDPQTALSSAEIALKQPAGSIPGAGEVARLALEALTKTGHTDLARQAVENWAHGPEAASLDSAVYEVVAMSVAQNSAGDAARWLQSLPFSPARNQAILTVSGVWAQSDPGAAIGWALGLPQADIRGDAMATIFADWLGQDRAAATQWLAEHASSPDRERLSSEALADPNFATSQPAGR